ncbi:MAG: hypothetical protein IT280_02710 [Ignavibacteria bacterium]|nr:hypothetical protein [Ignavibacteria bacterium]
MKNKFLILSTVFTLLNCTFIYCGQVFLDQINELKLSNTPTDIILYDNAYIISSEFVYSVSINDPYNLISSEIREINSAKSIAFIGHYCYALKTSSIDVYDFSKSPIAKIREIDHNGNVIKIVINNGYLYALNESSGMQVYDVNIADFPVYKNTQIIPFNPTGIYISNNKAYISGMNGHLSIIDVTDKSKLPIVGTYTSGGNFYEPCIDGNTAYIPQGSSGVQVLDISKLPTPQHQINLFGRNNAHQVVASNFYIWVADDKSVESFYNDAPASYYFAGNFKFKEKINKMAVVDGKYIYVCTQDKYLRILKINYKY